MNTDPAVDMQCIEKMHALLEDSYSEVLNDFLRDTQIYIDEVGRALHAGDRAAAAQTAHKIKSSAGQFGFRHIERIARLLDHPGETPTEALLKSHAELQEAYSQIGPFLKSQCSS